MKAFLRSLLASILGFFIAIFLVFLVVGIIIGAIIGSAGKEVVTVKDDSVLVLNLEQAIPERPVDNPFEDAPFFGDAFDRPVSLFEITESIRHAKDDDKIKGIYIESGITLAGTPTLKEIRDALLEFKESGKFIYAYSEIYTERNYFVASVADSIFVNPEGAFTFSGFNSEQIFFSKLLGKLDVDVKLFRAGKFKSAGETFTGTELSEANEKQLSEYMQSVYSYYLSQISASRKIGVQELRTLADEFRVKFPEDAVTYKLADKVVYEDEVLASIRARLDIEDEDDKIPQVEIADYSKAVNLEGKKPLSDNEIAVIYAVGSINSGEGDENNIGSDKLAKAIRKARLDDDVKAIVLRINSPGGSALASDVIWREVMLAKQVKPVIASMGDVAASGGYYIAAPCDTIICQPNTVTGSIGVFALIPRLQKFWDNKLGITFDRVKTSKYADFANPNREMYPEEELILQNYIDRVYNSFKTRVAEGRNLPLDSVEGLAQGRIYSGIQAKALGLVDGFGNLDDAIAIAAKMADLEKYELKILPNYEWNVEKLMNPMASAFADQQSRELKQTYSIYQKAEKVLEWQGPLMLLPYELY